MNERIKELEVQCWDDIAPEWAENVHMVFNIEKFAELLVQDACDRIEHEYKYALGEKTQWAMSQDVQDLLKEHYGIDYDPGEP